ncbi:DNA-directed RNA polymerase III subunit RPC7-like [Desmophyllum pertusum]|uniref:DNA-directed RNA polymerase III subunit RPC7-like n=1 Tax=Desmophyllum pertusum TaxID=174260 RepID=A0A9W9YTV4_9CNID|nr:DNA-directed RNA polymerase III subunit RPC7-like [Desmophyllum pertusum]
MAGRGRGRGRGLSFDVGMIGFGRGEALPAAIQQPPPIYPPLDVKPLPLRQTEADEYMLALKQELRGCMRELPYFVKAEVKRKDIERFSDRYREKQTEGLEWQPDWRLFPNELKIKVKKHRIPNSARPRIPKPGEKNTKATVEALKQLDEMVKKEVEDQAKDKQEEEAEDESGEEEIEYDEEEQEEENDYLVSHFDDDEDGVMDDDDMDEGPIY